MKVLLCHNHYQQAGGEDHSFAAEGRLLESRGHAVVRYTVHNDVIETMSRWETARKTIWNRETFHAVRGLIRREQPAVMHATNTFPLLSPSIYAAARAEGVAVVQSLRNYRLMCVNSYFLRDGKVCEDCLGRTFPWPGVVHRCYRDSRAASAVVALMTGGHRVAGTWNRHVDRFFAVSAFTRTKYVQAGFPADRISVKPNFIDPDPGEGKGDGGYAVFVGRLSPEKGIEAMLDAWSRLSRPVPLKIIGDGPMSSVIETAAARNPSIVWLGAKKPADVLALVGMASFLVMPSIWYETFGRTIIEAFATGTPVIASRLGAMEELVEDGRTGLLFEAGNGADLAAAVDRMTAGSQAAAMRPAARDAYLARYTAEPNYRMLLEIYERAIQHAAARSRSATSIDRGSS